MTFLELKTEVNRRLEENQINPVIFSAEEVATAINEGQDELSDAAESFERSSNLRLVANQMYYNLNHVIAEKGFLRFDRARNLQTGKWLDPVSVRHMDQSWRFWQTNNGEPQHSFIRGLWWLGVHPMPDTTGGFLKIYYKALPFDLVDDGDETHIPEEFSEGVIAWATYDLLSQAGESPKALLQFEMYAEMESAFVTWMNSRMTLDRIGGMRA